MHNVAFLSPILYGVYQLRWTSNLIYLLL